MHSDKRYLPYADRQTRPLILRDVLAIDRTRLANERTLLSWLRTAVVMLVAGITLLKLFAGNWTVQVIGVVLIVSSVPVALLGLRRYLRLRALIEAADKD